MKANETVQIPDELLRYLDTVMDVYKIPKEEMQVICHQLISCGVHAGMEIFKREMAERWSNIDARFIN